MPSGFGLSPLDSAIANQSAPGIGQGPGLVQPTARTIAPGTPPADPVESQLSTLNLKEPGRFVAVQPDAVARTQKEIEAKGPGEFMKGLQSSLVGGNATLAGNFAQAVGVLSDSPDVYDFAMKLQNWGKEKNEGLEAAVPGVENIRTDSVGNFLGDTGKFVKYQAGSGLGSSAPSLVTGVITSLITENPVLGIAAGAAAPSLIQNGGDLYGTLRDSPGVAEQVKAGNLTPKDIAKWSMAGAVPMAALDILGLEATLGAVGFKALKKTIMGRIAQGIATGAISEGTTEGLQQVIQESISGALGDKSPMTERVLRTVNSAIGGVIGGATIGGPGHIVAGARTGQQPAVQLHQAAVKADSGEAVPAATPIAPTGAPAAAPPQPEEPAMSPVAAPTPAQGPIGRAAELGRATEHAKNAEALVPAGSRVTISIPNVPNLDVTVEGYDATGMHVRDDDGEVHTLPMNDPDVKVTPVQTAQPEQQPVANVAPVADVAAGPAPVKVTEQETPETPVEPAVSAADTAAAPVKAPVKATGEPSISERAAAKAPAKPVVDDTPLTVDAIPLNRKVGEAQVAMPDEAHADLYDLGRKRDIMRKGSAGNMGRADALLAHERENAAAAMGISLEAVNAAADEYRNQVDGAAKAGGEIVAPKYEAGTETSVRDKWDGLDSPDARKAILDAAGVKRSPKTPWDNFTPAIKDKLRPHLAAKDTQAFSKESGTLGIPRDEMPQIAAQSHGGLVKHLNAQGITHETTVVSSADLKPTQAEFSPAKVEAAKGAEGDRAVIVANDGHIIDGHHQALAAQAEGKDVKAIVIDAPIKEALEAVKNSPSAQKRPMAELEAEGAVPDDDPRLTSNEREAIEYAISKAPPKGNDTAQMRMMLERGRTELPSDQRLLETALGQHHKATDPLGAANGPVERDKVIRAEAEKHYPLTTSKDAKGKETRYITPEYQAFYNGANGYDWNGAMPIHIKREAVADAYKAGMEFTGASEPDKAPAEKPATVKWRGDNVPRAQVEGGLNAFRKAAEDTAATIATLEKGKAKGDAGRITNLRRKLGERQKLLNEAETALGMEKTVFEQPAAAAGDQAAKWFGTREKADAYIAKQKLGATHEVQFNNRRYEIVEKAKKAGVGIDKWKPIGVNSKGVQLFEDERGVRSYVDSNIRVTESVGIVPTREGGYVASINRDSRDKDYLTADEAAARADAKAAPEHPGLIVKSLETGKETTIQPAGTVPPKPAYGASNKLVTADRAAEIRAKLRDKLKNQLNSGIDPEILAMGTELAAFHIEAGARRFGDFAKAVAADLGQTVNGVRKYLRSWYNGARDLLEDSGHDVSGMDDPEAVRAELKRLAETESSDGEPAKLETASRGALEGIPADAVRGTESERETVRGADASGRADVQGEVGAGGQGLQRSGSLGDRPGELPLSARGRDGAEAGQSDVGGKRADDAARSDEGHSASDPAADRVEAGKPHPKSAATPAAEVAGNYVITESDELGEGGQRTKFNQNTAAIRLLGTLANENRRATRSEQAILAKYVGWGGIKAVFPREDGSVTKGWEKQSAELRELLTDDEYKAASASTRNAHYTSGEIVGAMWKAVQRLGFAGGRMLEPSVGTGNFLGMMPTEARKAAQITGVELDRITGGIVKQLYPDANIQAPIGFQQFTVPDDYFDLAIGNPPFGSERLYDPERKHLAFSIHNFFFAKSLDALKPGGVLAMVVSDSLMDTQGDKARAYLSERADLLGAIRLPNDAFAKNAGTQVTTDIIFLRKREEGEAAKGPAWLNTRMFKDEGGNQVLLNEYFHANPDQMLGKFGAFGTMYREGDAALIKTPGQDTGKLLAAAIDRLPQNVMAKPGADVSEAPERAAPRNAADALTNSAFIDDKGKLWTRLPDHLGAVSAAPLELPNERAVERVTGMVRLRDAFTALRRAQLDESITDKKLAHLRDRLNTVYDAFVAKNGFVNLEANKRLFNDDPTWPQIAALEEKFDKGISAAVAKTTGEKAKEPSAQKAAVFSKRTQFPYIAPTSASTAKDALAISQGELGRVDVSYMAKLYGKSEADTVADLGDLIFKDPESGYEAQDAYLSGNVKRKLAIAVEAAKSEPEYRRNVEALRAVIPADLNPADIQIAPGAHWVPTQYVADFADYIADTQGAKAFYSAGNARWVVSEMKATAAAETRWGTERAGIRQILDAALHGATIAIRDKLDDGSSVLNQSATDAANEKVNRVSEEWDRWLMQDESRREALGALYNDTFNTDRLRDYDGSHLTLPGKVSDDVIRFRPHQLNFVWRMIQTPTALADHVVGAGKTFELIAGIMEMRRMGLAKKPMLTVPNHLVGQWAADFQKLYPGSNVLAATKKDFEAGNRKRLMARIATGDWDAVIVAHSSFGKIGVDKEFHERFINEQIADMETSIAAVREIEGKKTRNVAQLEKARDNLRGKLERLADTGAKDVGLTFQDVGIDWIGVDEAHEFKNLGFSSSMQRVAGIGNQAGSQKASDLYMKVQSVLEKTGNRNVVFATGTPISNTMAEMFTMQRYLSARTMKDLGLSHFDAWARMFGKVVTDWELSPSGQYKLKSRFAKFVNMPELMRQYRSFADVITRDDIKRQLAEQGRTLGVPKMAGGKPQLVVTERSDAQATYMGLPIKDAEGNDTENYPQGTLIWRAENLPKKAEKGADNMLKIMSDARKSALDMRMIDPSYPDNPGSKINHSADSMAAIYKQWDAKRGVQLVFIDLSTPKKAVAKEAAALQALIKAADEGDEAAQEKLDAMSPDEFLALNSKFSVYDDLREKLIARGVDPNHIAFIHDANTERQKEELFGKVRSGQLRFLFGSTAKMGAGMNVQNRLVALHHIDAPWRPSDLEQREGRIIRQGNELYEADPEGFEVGVYRYATKNTLDARMWQTIEAKARFIEQIRKGDLNEREVEDIAGEAANAAEMKAAASGNPLILEEMDLRQKVRKLDRQRTSHDREQYTIASQVKNSKKEIARLAEILPKLEADANKAAAIPREFLMDIDGTTHEKPKDAGAAILVRAAKMIANGQDTLELGNFGGFPLRLEPTGVFKGSAQFVIQIESSAPYQIDLGDVKAADPTGTSQRITNAIRRFGERVTDNLVRKKSLERDIPELEAQLRPWEHSDDLVKATERHRAIIAELQPKKKAAPAAVDPNAEPAAESVPDKPAQGMSADEVRATLAETPLAEPLARLIDAGKIVIDEEAPEGSHADAFVTNADGVIHLVASNLSRGTVTAGLLHEAFHSGVRPLIGQAAWTTMQSRLGNLYQQAKNSKGGAREVYDRALARMENAQDKSGQFSAALTPEEFGAYLISEQEKLPRAFGDWAREAIGTIKAWALRRFGVQLGAITPEQLRELAIAAIREGKAGTEPRSNTNAAISSRNAIDPDAETAGSNSPSRAAGQADYSEREALANGNAGQGNERSGLRRAGVRDQAPARAGEAQKVTDRTESVASTIRDTASRLTSPRSIGELSDMVKGLAEDARGPALGLLPLNTLADWAAKGQVAIRQYITLKRDMDAFRNDKQVAADEVVQRWRKVIGKGGKPAAALAGIMHDSTIAGIDPSLTDSATAAKAGYADLRARFVALAPAARALYGEVRDNYVKQADELDKLLLANIAKAMDQQVADAERRHKEELDQIRDQGLKGTERDDAINAAKRRLITATQKLEFGKKSRLAAMRASFEANRVPAPYFPLTRFGQYFATVRAVDGKVISFSRVETKGQLDALVRDLRKAHAGEKIETGVMSNKAEIRSGMDPRLMADVANILGGAAVDEEVMDAIWQRYLQSMPDLSIRKRFIHRGGVSGFQQDALRAYASHMFHAAHQMGRVKFGGDLQELVAQATDQAKLSDSPIQAMKIANELRLRHEWVMNPTNSAWATNATALGFVYYLGASPASAVVNLSQTAIMGVPILGSRYGMGKAVAALARAGRDFMAGKGGVEGAKLSPDERAAFAEFNRRGVVDKSNAHDLAGVGEHGVGYNPTRVRVMKAVSFLFHQAERFNREVTALAAYRLARGAGEGAAQAIDKAADLTWQTHFDYSNTNRPRAMQGDVAKVALLFKNFQINMIYRLFRDVHQSFKGETPEARREARYQLAGIMGMYGLMAGALGVPLLQQIVIPLYGLMFGDDDDDKSAKEQFRGDVIRALGPQLAGMVLDGVPGYLTGVSLTQRMGMPDLWFQSDDRVQNSKDWWNSMVNELGGPVLGMAHNAYNGFNVVRDGKGVARGVEMVAPTAARNLMRAWRYSQEGVVNLRGDAIVPQDGIGLQDVAKQAVGFTPAVVAEQYDRNNEKKNMEKRVGEQRKALLTAYAKAAQTDDQAAMDSVMEDISKFNAKPLGAIRPVTSATIHSSMTTRNRLTSRAENGIIVQNRELNDALNARLPDRVY